MSDTPISVALVGDPNVGKTKLIYRITENVFDPTRVETCSPDKFHAHRIVNGVNRHFVFWDVPGQQLARDTAISYVKKGHIILALFDPKAEDSIKGLDDWAEVTSKTTDKCYIPVATKHDLWAGEKIYKERNILKNVPKNKKSRVIETSSLDGYGIEELLQEIVERVPSDAQNDPAPIPRPKKDDGSAGSGCC